MVYIVMVCSSLWHISNQIPVVNYEDNDDCDDDDDYYYLNQLFIHLVFSSLQEVLGSVTCKSNMVLIPIIIMQ